MIERKRRTTSKNYLEQMIYVIIGSFIVSFAYNGFLLPNYIAAGGVSGISTITEALFELEPAYVIWGINIPILITSYFLLGRAATFRSLVGSLVLPFFVFLSRNIEPFATDPLFSRPFRWVRCRYRFRNCIFGRRINGRNVVDRSVHSQIYESITWCKSSNH